MGTTIITKNGSGAPAADDLVAGELAVDLTNKRLYTKDSGNNVLELGSSPSTIVFSSVASNITPSADDTYDLGATGTRWRDIYIDGTAYLDAINFNGTAITATAAELNILDGVTSTAAELNILDGVTSTAAELNILDGVTATTAELNILDGVTSTTAELNILDGVTSTTAELNILDGVTATATELNYVDGVTSAIQTQLDAKAPTASPTLTGTITAADLIISNRQIATADASGTNTAGNSVTLKAGASTGSATGGSLIFQTTPAGSTGTSVNSFSTVMTLDESGIDVAGAVEFDSLSGTGSVSVTDILDQDDMSSDSATALATQQSIKAYVDSQIGSNNELSEVLAIGNTTGSTNIVVTAGQSITTDTIAETTAAAGVTVDSLLIKDGGITAAGTSTFAGQTISDLGTVTTANIDGGSIDGTTIGAATAAAITGTTITATDDVTLTGASYNAVWDSSDSALEFADNAKAVFGAGSDLQIYHDGSDSIINDNGTGSLKLQTGASTKLEVTSTGIDVTGTVTADGLTVDGSTTFTGNTSPASDEVLLNLSSLNGTGTAGNMLRFTDLDPTATNNGSIGKIQFYSDDTDAVVVEIEGQNADASPDGRLIFKTAEGTTLRNRINIENNGDISFYEDTGTTAKLFWDASAESLGIGLSSGISSTLHVNTEMSLGADADNRAIVGYTPSRAYIGTRQGGTNYFDTLNVSGGNVGIGTTSPIRGLQVQTASSNFGNVFLVDSASGTTGTGGGVIFGSDDGLGTDVSVAAIQGIKENSTAGNQQGALVFTTKNIAAVNTERMRIDSSGNVQIGNSTYGANLGQLRVINDATSAPASLSLMGYGNVTDSAEVGKLEFALQQSGTGGQVHAKISGLASGTNEDEGQLAFYTSDNTLTERMRIDEDGNVGIGTSSPAYVLNTNYNANATFSNAASDFTQMWQNSGTNALGVALADDSTARFVTNNGYALAFNNAGTEAMRIDTSGNLLVGTTNANPTSSAVNDPGVELSDTGGVRSTVASNPAATFNRKTDDGDVVIFRKNGTTVGSIGTTGGDLTVFGSASGHCGLRFLGDPAIGPTDSSGALTDGACDIGVNNQRFKDLYLSGGAYLGGTGAANHLDDYEEGTFTPTVVGSTTAGTATYAFQTGRYTKVGNLVTVQIYVNWSSGTGAGVLQFDGLPFTTKNATAEYGNATIGEFNNITGTAGHMLCGIGLPNNTKIQFAENDFNSAPTTVSYDAAGYIVCSMTYIAN